MISIPHQPTTYPFPRVSGKIYFYDKIESKRKATPFPYHTSIGLSPLHPEIPRPLPPGPRRLLRALRFQLGSKRIEINLSSSLIDRDLRELDAERPLSVIQLVADEEHDHDRRSEIRLEERFGVGLASDREQRDVELGNEAEDVEPETDPGADGAEHGRERQVVGGAAVHGPRFAEADMREADAAPGEEVGQPGDGQQPGEDGASGRGFVDVSQAAEEQGDDEDYVGTAFGVDAGTDRGTHAACAESLHGSRGGKGAGVGNGEDREGDDRVED